MNNGYTQKAKENCLELVDRSIDAIWDDINSLPEDSEPDRWRKKIQNIANEYAFSSRYALMRWLQERVTEKQFIDMNDPEKGYTIILDDGTSVRFDEINISHALMLSNQELKSYETILMSIAERQADAEYEYNLAIIQKALMVVQKKTTLLSREEAFRLGHILQFSLKDMEWFLMRVCDVEGGFRYNKSNDLIEAYGFLTQLSWKQVEQIKEEYVSCYGNVKQKTIDEKENDWTRGMEVSLPKQIMLWPSDDRLSLFLQWLGEHSSYLDCVSKTATVMYRNLAAYTYNISTMEEWAPAEKDYVKCIREIVNEKELDDQALQLLYDNGRLSEKKAKKLAGTILLENLNLSMSEQTDKTKAFHVITMLTNGKMTISGGVNKSRTRVLDLLMGRIDVEKSDLLYLLWFNANLCWFDGDDIIDAKRVGERVQDFIHVADNCLDIARLPAFYPPHIIEQSMLLSIVYAFKGSEKSDPAEIYEMVCSSIIKRRKKHTNKKNK